MDVVTAYWLKILTHPRKTFPMIFLLLDNIISTIWSLFWVASMIITFFYIFVDFSWEKLYVFTTVASALVIFQFIFGMLQLRLSLNYGSELGDDTNKYFRFAGWVRLGLLDFVTGYDSTGHSTFHQSFDCWA
ncbi:hypothetical protein ACDP95_08895 [Weissella confusa]